MSQKSSVPQRRRSVSGVMTPDMADRGRIAAIPDAPGQATG
jgi:hypothetical protein